MSAKQGGRHVKSRFTWSMFFKKFDKMLRAVARGERA